MEKIQEKKFTEGTYDKAARGYSCKYEAIGARTADVDRAFELVHTDRSTVVEIGCGGGREAKYILTKTDRYVGVDISEGMLEIARENLPDAHFEKADVVSFGFPEGTDIVFAFASLLHSSREEIRVIFGRIYESLNDGGVVFVSLKRQPEYATEVVEGEYGPRQFYYYTREVLQEAAGGGFEEVFYEEQEREEDWFTMILRKCNLTLS